jgi:hypothetical protein
LVLAVLAALAGMEFTGQMVAILYLAQLLQLVVAEAAVRMLAQEPLEVLVVVQAAQVLLGKVLLVVLLV